MISILPRRLRGMGQLVRFYQAAMINTAFGFGLYALLVWIGLNPFLAQIVSHVSGVVFNYFTYSRHVFHERQGSKARFIAAYAVNYFVSLGFLGLFSLLVRSPYLAGGLATICASLTNYAALRHLVFRQREAT